MSTENMTQILTKTVEELSVAESLQGLFHEHRDGDPLPSSKALEEIIELSRSILFPGYYGKSTVNINTIRYHIGVNVERLHKLLADQIMAGLCFMDGKRTESFEERSACRRNAESLASEMIARYPSIRQILATDVVAAYNGDPAAENYGEIISCYPIIKTLVNYRIAHELLILGVPLIPRIITEMAHSETGIDIHPGARIIGNNVKLYQGVTLGAKSFPLDENGNPIKGIPRHPILEDDVVVYSNATILGRITIGKGCVVGANLWITRDMKPFTKKYKQEKTDNIDIEFNHGTGI